MSIGKGKNFQVLNSGVGCIRNALKTFYTGEGGESRGKSEGGERVVEEQLGVRSGNAEAQGRHVGKESLPGGRSNALNGLPPHNATCVDGSLHPKIRERTRWGINGLS